MCVRTLSSDDKDVVPQVRNKYSKAKDKYKKIYDDLTKPQMESPDEAAIEDVPMKTDLLQRSTMQYRNLMSIGSKYYEVWQASKIYKILFSTSQPAHIIMIVAILCVLSSVFPTSTSDVKTGQSNSTLWPFIYIVSFALHFGSQMWMTFVSGLSLYFALPRYAFGQVQQVLFPRYFALNACLSLTTLLIFVKYHPFGSWDTEITVQVSGMTIAFFLELLTRLYFVPPILKLIAIKSQIERSSNIGNEIGHYNLGPLKHCPHYMKLHYAFRRMHTTVATGNIITMACTISHLYYVASRICVI